MSKHHYVLVGVLSISFLITVFAMCQLPESSGSFLGGEALLVPQETGVINLVAAVLYDYRGLDTLGETVVIFAASLVVSLLATNMPSKMLHTQLSPLVQYGVDLTLPFILLFGFYIILFGHISPGGGFTGGAMLASGAIVATITYSTTNKHYTILSHQANNKIEVLGLGTFLGIGLVGVAVNSFFLANAASGVSLGTPGTLLSGGWIPLLSVASGMKVGAGLSLIFSGLLEEDS